MKGTHAMLVTTNSNITWKQVADENQKSVKLLARISIGLFVLALVSGAYAYSAHLRYDNLCASTEGQSGAADGEAAQESGDTVSGAHCT